MSSREMDMPSREINVRRFCANIVDPDHTHVWVVKSVFELRLRRACSGNQFNIEKILASGSARTWDR